jgi:hypothetical protein
MKDGRLELDEGSGLAEGPRVVDPAAGVIRYADAKKTIAIADLSAVAVVFVERMVKQRVGRSSFEMRPKMIHGVVLVPRRAPKDVEELFAALAAQPGVPIARPLASQLFSIHGASASVDAASTTMSSGGGALRARRTAKAIARVARLPLVELYGEFCLWRAADHLDLRLTDRLAHAPSSEPGPCPLPLKATASSTRLEVTWPQGTMSLRIAILLLVAIVLVSVPLFIVAIPAAIGCLVLAFITLAWVVQSRGRTGARLIVEDATIQTTKDGRDERIAVDRVELVRVVDATLVIVDQSDETRLDLPNAETATWLRQAIEHHVRPKSAPYR